MHQSVDDLPRRVRKRVQSLLMADEQFATAATATDGLLDRWATHIIVTDQRLLLVKIIGLESTVTGVRLDRLDTCRAADGVLQLAFKYDTYSYGFDSQNAADTLVAAVDRHRPDETTPTPKPEPEITLEETDEIDAVESETLSERDGERDGAQPDDEQA
ncbi:MAG: hypothetical protein U5K28_10155 [Halobacteriales archaeon]|nr:hypothetical protein [Halobacteriales archaeon]